MQQKERQVNVFVHTRIFNVYNIHTGSNEYTNVFQQIKVNTYLSMKKQYMKGVQKWKKDFLISVSNYWSGQRNIFCVQRTEAKRG